MCEHIILFDHVIDWANSRILITESNFSERLGAESWFILSRPKVINRSDGEFFPVVYRSLLWYPHALGRNHTIKFFAHFSCINVF